MEDVENIEKWVDYLYFHVPKRIPRVMKASAF